MAAEADELEVRRLPEANAAPATSALPPPAMVEGTPPVVTRVDQVVPRATQRLVSWWRRRLQRCMRAAARGDCSLARRMRPDDLFLDHEEHSVPATALWDWDLTPISCGEPAVAMQPSGGGGVGPATSVELRAWLRDSVGFPDQAIVSEVVNGVSDDSTGAVEARCCAHRTPARWRITRRRRPSWRREWRRGTRARSILSRAGRCGLARTRSSTSRCGRGSRSFG
jgi:hypothetical protein